MVGLPEPPSTGPGSGTARLGGMDPEAPWTRYTTANPGADRRPVDRVELGPDADLRLDRRLLGDLDGKRVIELGCGAGHGAVAMAQQGAKVIAVEPTAAQLNEARSLSDRFGVSVELHQGEMADLAFVRADSIDAVIAVHSLAAVADIDRVFRQAHRILRPEHPIVLTLPHPVSFVVRGRSYFDDEPLGEGVHLTHPHRVSEVFTQLTRSNFRVDTLLEPEGPDGVPSMLVVRARKVGT